MRRSYIGALLAVSFLHIGCVSNKEPLRTDDFNEIGEEFYYLTNYMPQPMGCLVFLEYDKATRLSSIESCRSHQASELKGVMRQMAEMHVPSDLTAAKEKSLNVMGLSIRDLRTRVDDATFERATNELSHSYPAGYVNAPAKREYLSQESLEYRQMYQAVTAFQARCDRELSARLGKRQDLADRRELSASVRDGLRTLESQVKAWHPIKLVDIQSATLEYIKSCQRALSTVDSARRSSSNTPSNNEIVAVLISFNKMIHLIIRRHLPVPTSGWQGTIMTNGNPPYDPKQ